MPPKDPSSWLDALGGGGGGPCGCAEGPGGGPGHRESLLSWSAPGWALPARWRRLRGGGRARAHTVKMLERRLDCLRMGVGVEEAAMVSMRSSRWLTLGVEGTEDE